MKIIKTFENFTQPVEKFIVDDVEYTDGDILSIKLSNGYELIPGDDQESEFVTLKIEGGNIFRGIRLKKGDEISFKNQKKQIIKPELWWYTHTDKELGGIHSIDINGKNYPAKVVSPLEKVMPENPRTFLIYRNLQ